MITYQGILSLKKVKYLVMSNELDQEVRIPVEDAVASRISAYISKIATEATKPVERLNDEPSD